MSSSYTLVPLQLPLRGKLLSSIKLKTTFSTKLARYTDDDDDHYCSWSFLLLLRTQQYIKAIISYPIISLCSSLAPSNNLLFLITYSLRIMDRCAV